MRAVFHTVRNITVAGAKRSVAKLNLSKTYTYFDSIIIQCRCSKSTVTPYRTISGSYEWLRLGQGATDRQWLLRSPAAVAYRDRSLRMVALSRTIGEYRWQEQEIVRLVVAINDRCTINRDGRRPMIPSIDRCILRSIVRAIVASCDRRYDQSWGATIDRTINHSIVQPLVRSIVATYDRSYDQSWHQTIWNRRLEVLNLTIDLATTDFALVIIHDLCDQSYILSTIFRRGRAFFLRFRS